MLADQDSFLPGHSVKGTRRKGRELALQALYQIEITSDPSVAAVEESMLGVVDQFCALADEGFVDVAFEGQSVPDQVRMVVEGARTAHPRRLDVLDAIADAPVDRKVAKAARTARLRLRT